jgi:hypothetical protein
VFEIVERILAALIILALLTLLIILAFPVSAPSPGPARTTTEVKPGDNKETETRVTEVKTPQEVKTPPAVKPAEPSSTAPKPVVETAKPDADKLPEQTKPVVIEVRRPTANHQSKADKERIEELRIENTHRVETVKRDPVPPRRRRRIVEDDCADGSCEECCGGGCVERRPRLVERRRYAANRDRPYWANRGRPYWASGPVPDGVCPD